MIEITPEYLASQGLSPTFPQRFWAKVQKTETCWVWTGAVDSVGYGSINTGLKPKRTLRSHVASWIIHNGPISKGTCVLHDCPGGDNRLCVHPAHLYLGDHSVNGHDRKVKCQAHAGEGMWNHKLTWSQVLEIRASGDRQADLARRFGIDPSIISEVIHFKRWLRPR